MSVIKKKYKEGTDFVTSQWGDETTTKNGPLTNYECAYCQFKTTDADKMNAHLDAGKAAHALHPWPETDPDDDDVKLNGMHPALARKSGGRE